MEKEEIKIKSREIIKKLTEKFDKCNWRTASSGMFVLSFEGVGSIHIDKQILIVFDRHGTPIIENIPTEEEKDAYNHVLLYSKIYEKDRIFKDKHLDILMRELDNIR